MVPFLLPYGYDCCVHEIVRGCNISVLAVDAEYLERANYSVYHGFQCVDLPALKRSNLATTKTEL